LEEEGLENELGLTLNISKRDMKICPRASSLEEEGFENGATCSASSVVRLRVMHLCRTQSQVL
jgi:hypothetical protein